MEYFFIFAMAMALLFVMICLSILFYDNYTTVKHQKDRILELERLLRIASVNDLRHPISKKFISAEEFDKLRKTRPELWTNSL